MFSRILRVHGLSGHEPNNKNLQNKQGTEGGVPTGSPMLKLVKEIRSVLQVNSQAYFHIPPFLALLFPFMKEDHPPLSMERSTFYRTWVIGSRNGRQVRPLRFNSFSFWVTKLPESSTSKIG